MMRAWVLTAALLLGLTACATRRNSASLARPKCAGPWLATVNNNGSDDAEAYASRRYRTYLGIVKPGTTKEFLTTEPEVYAKSASGGETSSSGRYSGSGGRLNKNLKITVVCADKA